MITQTQTETDHLRLILSSVELFIHMTIHSFIPSDIHNNY